MRESSKGRDKEEKRNSYKRLNLLSIFTAMKSIRDFKAVRGKERYQQSFGSFYKCVYKISQTVKMQIETFTGRVRNGTTKNTKRFIR